MSKEENGQYTGELVQNQFQKSLATGFRREAIRQQLRATLKSPIDDIKLLQEISDVVMTETEHDSKVKPAKVTVNQVKVQTETKPGAAAKPANPMIAEITKLTSQVSQLSGLQTGLRDDMDKLKQELQGNIGGLGRAQNPLLANPNPVGSSGTPQNGVVQDGGNPAPPNNPVAPGGGFRMPSGMLQDGSNPAPPNNPVLNPGGGFRGRGRGRGGFRGGRGGGRGFYPNFGYRVGCESCVQSGIFCNHCLMCHQVGHKIADCPLNQKNDSGDQG